MLARGFSLVIYLPRFVVSKKKEYFDNDKAENKDN